MMYSPRVRLQKNFILKEVVEWGNKLPNMSDVDRRKSYLMAKEALTAQVLVNAAHQASRLQDLRDNLNLMFWQYNLRINVTSWLRPKQWELYRGRAGDSMHTTGHATDIVVVGARAKDHAEVMDAAYRYLNDQPGFTKYYKEQSFIHNDQRGVL